MAGARADERHTIRTSAEHEHEDLVAGIERIHGLGEQLGDLSVDQRSAGVRGVLTWIEADLKPHMAWEESWLFPRVDARAHTPWATRIVRFDHRRIAAHAQRLLAHVTVGSHSPSSDTLTLVADLSALEALLRADLEREDRFLLPLLEPEADRWEPEWRD